MTVAPLLTAALRYGAIVAAAVAVIAGAIGWATSGAPGLLGGLLGAVAAAVFVGLTAVSILIAGRVTKGDATNPAFFGIVLGGWVIKLVVFIVVLLVLRGQPWIEPLVFFFSVLVSVIASLVVDMVVMARARVPYVGDVELPTSADPAPGDAGGS